MEYKTASSSSDIQWCFSQVKGTLDDDVTEGKTIIIVIKKSYVKCIYPTYINDTIITQRI